MPRVSYCTDSTIVEAWATVLGMPVPIVPDESPGLILAAKKKIEGLTDEPSLVVANIQRPDQPVPPFWNRQVSWNRRQFLARIGHRYLSVHFLGTSDRKYETYEVSFKPGMDAWLDLFREFYSDDLIRSSVNRVGYGYVNQFRFAAAGFDLSEKFKLNVGVQLESASEGLAGMDLRFEFREPRGAFMTVQIAVGQDQGDPEALLVTTKVAAEIVALSPLFLDDPNTIRTHVHRAKETAKQIFFEIATESTHRLMGAQYVSG